MLRGAGEKYLGRYKSGERTKEMPFEGNTLARKEAEDQAAIEQRHDAGRDQVAPTSLEPGAGQEVRPQPEYPAAGTDVYAGKTEQPDQRAAQQNDDRTDGQETG